MNLVLCGPPFSGKSTVSQLVAEHLDWELLDTDLLIEKKVGLSCRDLYLEMGEEVFRATEREVLDTLTHVQHKVIALGGGVTDVDLVKKLGLVFYLQLPVEVLWDRMMLVPEKPAYLSETDPFKEFSERISSRLSLYEAMAEQWLNAEHTPQELANQVIEIGEAHGIK